jgi:hypothetical protein
MSSVLTSGSGCAGCGQYLESQHQKGVAGQNRRALVEGMVQRGLTPAHIVVSHARQVIVNKRLHVDAFDGEPGAERLLARNTEQVAGGHDQERPQPLAAADGIAHGLVKPIAAIPRDRHGLLVKLVYLKRQTPHRRAETACRIDCVQHEREGTLRSAQGEVGFDVRHGSAS